MANNFEFNIVDPNKEDNGLQPLEDLNIDVQLTVKTRGRKNQERRTIKFVDGTINNSNGTKSLSTNFTEIGTDFGDRNDLETLGIKSINIDFNASYTPMVKITFIDLRGDSIITKGDESKYNFFFELPYPVFELKVKGFYGKTVTYCLNMTKYGSKFNSDGGHFEINCEFIGYTYAFLSDMLMGYMKAITNTDVGKDKFNELVTKVNSTLPAGENPVPVPTLSDFIINASKLNTDLEKLKNNGDYILLSKTINSLSELNDIKTYLRTGFYNGIGRLNKLETLQENVSSSDKSKFLIFEVTNKNFDYFNDENKKSKGIFDKLLTKVKTYNKNVGGKYVITESKAVGGTNTPESSLSRVADGGSVARVTVTDGKIFEFSAALLTDDKVTIINELVSVRPVTDVYIYECTALVDEINLRETELKKLKTDLEGKVSNLTNDLVVERFGNFKPTLRNILLMLTTHAEVLVDTINNVAENINISKRKSSLLRKAAEGGLLTDTYNNGGVIYPFPNYAKNRATLSWIGELDSGLPEVKYVEDLLDAMIRQQKTEEVLIQGIGDSATFYPVNINDNYQDKINPYIALNNSAEVKDALLAVILRASTYFLTSLNPKKRIDSSLNKLLNDGTNTDFAKKEIELVARVEANTLFNALIFDDKNSNLMYDYLETLGATATDFYESVKTLISQPNFITGTDLGTTFNNGIFEYKKNDKIFVYQFLTDLENSRQIIPFTDDLRSRQIAKTDYTTSGTNFVNLLSKNANNSFDIVVLPELSYNYPNLPNKPNKDEEMTSSGATLTLTEDTTYGQILAESKLDFNFGNTGGTTNEVTIYGGNEDSLKYRTINTYSIDDVSTQGNLTYAYYYNVAQRTIGDTFVETAVITTSFGTLTSANNIVTPITYEPHITGLGIQTRNDVFNSDAADLLGLRPSVDKVGSFTNDSSKTIAYDKNPIDDDKDELTFSFYDTYDEKFFGRKLALLNQGGSDNALDIDTIYLSNVGWSDSDKSGNVGKPITLFGSELYNKQTDDKGKALLYLNSLPYKVGSDLDILISKLLNRQGALVEVPYMLMALIGGMLWRSQQTADPIKFYKTSANGLATNDALIEMASINLDGSGDPNKLLYPSLDEFLIVEQDNAIKNRVNTVQYLYHLSFIKSAEKKNLKYVKLPKSISTMNLTLKQKFIDVFEDWYGDIDEGWASIKSAWELIPKKDTFSWEDNVNRTSADALLNGENYKVIQKITNDEAKTYNNLNTNVLTLLNVKRDELNPASTLILNSLLKSRYIRNAVPQVWNSDKSTEVYSDAFIKESFMKTYLENFYTELIKLRSDKLEEEAKEEEATKNVNSSELKNLKLNVYRNIKAIHDKWLGDGDLPNNAACGVDGNLFNSFSIIDKFYKDIGDDVIINPKSFVNNIVGNSNTSLANFLSKFLASMNFDFIALPTFVDLNDSDNIKEMFRPLNYNSNATTLGPQFICMYIGDTSKNLNLSKSTGNPQTDGTTIMHVQNVDDDTNGSNNKALPSAGFIVKYGQQNQSIFKDLELNQQEFTETDEGLIATDALSNPNSIKNGTFINQSLFNIYSTRSYNCGVTAMGNAMIQPMTYFQLENVPMFKGAYLIKNVSHSIKPNTMETRFTGSRVTAYRVPLLDENTVYLNMLGSINALTDTNTSLTADLTRTNPTTSFGNNDPKEVDKAIPINNINEDIAKIDDNTNNGVIYV